MIYQNDDGMLPDIQHEGCAFCSLAFFREKYQKEPWTVASLNAVWKIAKDTKIIDKQNVIQDWQRLANLMGCHLRYVEGHFQLDAKEAEGAFTICAWFNPKTNFTHFVVGTSKPVEYDPIKGGSRTVREGAPKGDGLRIFQILA